tara:strand:+ start:57 stop:746 length:690 start_codon:yes stop_codon:yes gene_type:complete
MMKVLAIDTSRFETRVGLQVGSTLIEKVCTEKMRASQELLSLIKGILDEADLLISQVDAIGVVTGPGSFTGVRIGIAVAQGLSAANSTKVVGVSSMALYAKSGCSMLGDGNFLVSLLAKSPDVYLGAYHCESGKPNLVCDEFVLNYIADFQPSRQILDKKWTGLGDGWSERELIEKALGLKLKSVAVKQKPSMKDFLDLCTDNLQAPKRKPSDLVLPNYIKEPHYSVAK